MERAATPKTDFAKFTITPKDIGSEAVRPGHMAELEQERHVLLIAAKILLRHIRDGAVTDDAVTYLQAAISIAEGGEFIRKAA